MKLIEQTSEGLPNMKKSPAKRVIPFAAKQREAAEWRRKKRAPAGLGRQGAGLVEVVSRSTPTTLEKSSYRPLILDERPTFVQYVRVRESPCEVLQDEAFQLLHPAGLDRG